MKADRDTRRVGSSNSVRESAEYFRRHFFFEFRSFKVGFFRSSWTPSVSSTHLEMVASPAPAPLKRRRLSPSPGKKPLGIFFRNFHSDADTDPASSWRAHPFTQLCITLGQVYTLRRCSRKKQLADSPRAHLSNNKIRIDWRRKKIFGTVSGDEGGAPALLYLRTRIVTGRRNAYNGQHIWLLRLVFFGLGIHSRVTLYQIVRIMQLLIFSQVLIIPCESESNVIESNSFCMVFTWIRFWISDIKN